MGCKGKNRDEDNCVCEVLRAVADAQDEVDGVDTDCDVSCDRSIRELLAGAQTPTNDLDTIPLILYCGDCVPFEGFGTRIRPDGEGTRLDCFKSFFFRVTSVDDDCCAKVELLTTRGDRGRGFDDPCEQLQTGGSRNEFFRTGICLTIDLDCFCAVTCLDPVAALPLSSLPGPRKED